MIVGDLQISDDLNLGIALEMLVFLIFLQVCLKDPSQPPPYSMPSKLLILHVGNLIALVSQ